MNSTEATARGKDRTKRGSRRVSREFALQALYQWLLNGDGAEALCGQAEEKKDFVRAEPGYFRLLAHGVLDHAAELRAAVQPFLDRPAQQLSPIEHALLLLGTYELMFAPDVPFRVAINEAVELAKSYGGTDGHKYVNGVLDKLAAQVRPGEVKKA
jgi:N utilization substance protein B